MDAMATREKTTQKRLAIRITGAVQGVGFRPHIFRLAVSQQLSGWVCNDESGIYLEIQGVKSSEFIDHLKNSYPPLAQVQSFVIKELPLKAKEQAFIIKPTVGGNANTQLNADTPPCEYCLAELFDVTSRFYLYPFINCCDCGPRFTITGALPYRREKTALASFVMCQDCQNEFANPMNRRFHAETISCENCGPAYSHSLTQVADRLLAGEVVALKSVGGYQYLCDANNKQAIEKLRAIKNRPDKPFAIMVLNPSCAKRYVVWQKEAEQLSSRARPIIIMPSANKAFAETLAPGLHTQGVMLPNSPAHYLLFYYLLKQPKGLQWLSEANNLALVITSANVQGEPMIVDDVKAQQDLTAADLIISHNRAIVQRLDDAVMSVGKRTFYLRCGRGISPQVIELLHELPTSLGLGGHLKNTVCLIRNKEAFITQHIGDLSSQATIQFYKESIAQLLKLIPSNLEVIAHDWHSHYYSSIIAQHYKLPCVAVQHHQAHFAAVLAEHGIEEPVLGLVVDGLGLGENDEWWGGELLHYNQQSYQRVGHFKKIPQVGGDIASREPWRMALSVFSALNQLSDALPRFSDRHNAKNMAMLLEKTKNMTTSCGRLFDAASALAGFSNTVTYEAQAALYLQSLVTEPKIDKNGFIFTEQEFNLLPLFSKLVLCSKHEVANLFHGTLAFGIAQWLLANAKKYQVNSIVLTGGCMQNDILASLLVSHLHEKNMTIYFSKQLPANDAGISLGQAFVAANSLRASSCV